MKNSFLMAVFAGLFFSSICSCFGPNQQQEKTGTTQTAEMPSFTISVKPYPVPDSLPFLQSGAWARQGDKILLIGGRIQGFHGLPDNNDTFNKKKANTSIWVMDLADFSFSELPLDQNNPEYLQFFSSNLAFFQDNDTLYLVGGYGIQKPSDLQSNYTFDRLVAIQISEMIKQVESGAKGDPKKAIINTANSPFLQVAGGELIKVRDFFYLMFGQNYNTVYNTKKTGDYTSAIRKFHFVQGSIADTSSYIDTVLHRRDLTVATVVQNNGSFYAAYGGVFTKDNDGYANPVYIDISNNAQISVKADTLRQLTNQYDCAYASIYDPDSNTNVTVLLGGIGKYQYDPIKKTWEHGDAQALLPFVKTITLMKYQNGVMHQYIQLPPVSAQLPEFVGANAIFFPHTSLVYANGIIDYSKIKNDSTAIGYMYGGIKSPLPTSSMMYPTVINNTVYEVYLKKDK